MFLGDVRARRIMVHKAKGRKRVYWGLVLACVLCAGCARLFGWDIHAPALLSARFHEEVTVREGRLALYITEASRVFISEDRGGRLADPQTYHIGEAFEPLAIEAFQAAFSEFVYCEIEPTDVLLKAYGIPYLAVIDITGFDNRVRLKGQSVSVMTDVYIFDADLRLCARFFAEGASDAKRVFAKRGGPEVNLNAALEKNITATVRFIHDLFAHAEEKR
jgi:hypothetical protein